MSDHSVLELTLKEILGVVKPVRKDWEIRFQIIEELRAVIKSLESFRDAIVEPFGSFVSNLFSRWGDLDISVELPTGSFIASAGKKRKQSLLEDLLKALRKNGGWHRLKLIGHARVPLLKSVSNRQEISCDISIDNIEGLVKSRILFWMNQIDGRFRDMVLLVKEWAKAHDINNPKAGTFNSYSLSLLVIFHFQTCVPAIFPPLKEIYPGNVVDDLKGIRHDALRHISEKFADQIRSFTSDKSRAVNQSSLSELLISFFAKFSDLSFRASELGISPFLGRWEDLAPNTRWLPKTYAIFIEDPFEQPENTARSVGPRQLAKITEAFQITHFNLSRAQWNKKSILSSITTPEVSRFIAGASVDRLCYSVGPRNRGPMINRGYNDINAGCNGVARRPPATTLGHGPVGKAPFTNSAYNAFAGSSLGKPSASYQKNGAQVHRNPHLRSSPPQAKNKKAESGSSSSSARQAPVKFNQGQNQQIWRPKMKDTSY